MSYRRMAICNLGVYGLGTVRRVSNVGITCNKGFMSLAGYQKLLGDLIQQYPADAEYIKQL
jgi:hypothetical protein